MRQRRGDSLRMDNHAGSAAEALAPHHIADKKAKENAEDVERRRGSPSPPHARAHPKPQSR